MLVWYFSSTGFNTPKDGYNYLIHDQVDQDKKMVVEIYLAVQMSYETKDLYVVLFIR